MGKTSENDERFKRQMKAWMMIQVTGQTSVNFLNIKKLKKEMQEYISAFSSGDELSEFADYFIDSCLSNRGYRTAIFGAIPMSDAGAATRIAQDIEEVTYSIPHRFGLEKEAEPVRNAFFNAFVSKYENAEKIFSELGIDYKREQ